MSDTATLNDGAITEGTVLPPAVRRIAEEADRQFAENRAAREAAEQRFPTVVVQTVPFDAPAPAPVEVPPPDPNPELPLEMPRDAAYWEQRFKTLEGKFQNEMPSVAARARAAEAETQRLRAEIDQIRVRSLEEAMRPAPVQASSPTVTKEDTEAYGDELVAASQRWARTAVDPEIQELRAKIAKLEATTTSVVETTDRNSVNNYLDISVKGWRELNVDPAFLEWLGDYDSLSGRKRHDMLTEAYTKGETLRCKAIFDAYVDQSTPQTARTQPVHPAPAAERLPLQDLAAPGRGRPMSPGVPADKRNWTQAEIAAFYQSSTRGKWVGREAEYASIDADILAAASEGRIR